MKKIGDVVDYPMLRGPVKAIVVAVDATGVVDLHVDGAPAGTVQVIGCRLWADAPPPPRPPQRSP